MTTLTLSNAAIVLPDVIVHGTLRVEDGRIAGIDPARHPGPAACDMDGDFLIPGAIDLHTDNLERQVQPRSNARWPSRSAFLAHDAQCAAAGITTVFDALCVGDLGFEDERLRTRTEGVADLDALAPTGLLRCDHLLHLRCELPAIGMMDQLETLAAHPTLRLVSLMDHTPGTGQYKDVERYILMRRRDGQAEPDILRRIGLLRDQRERLRGPNRAGLLARFAGSATALASHDDRTETEIAENLADGIAICEFPVTHEAAAAARAGRMAIIGGAPNLVRGGSHTGNVRVEDLLAAGLIDALASDYVPCSLVEAAFAAAVPGGLPLHAAIRLVTATPADMTGLSDRGRIAPGLRADLVRVRVHDGQPVVRQAWRQGVRIA